MKIKIIASKKYGSEYLKEQLLNAISKTSLEVVEDNYDLSIAIGGDGTFLHSVRENNFNPNIMYIGINNGKLGFLQNVKTNELIPFVKELENKKYSIDEIKYEKIKVYTDESIFNFKALNEVVIRDEGLKTLRLDVMINEEIIENVVGDGVLISTPIGSTAYNMSIGGPIVYTDLSCLILTPVSPINNQIFNTIRNPIVFHNKTLTVIPVEKSNDLVIVIDGIVKNIKEVRKIEIELSEDTLKLMRLNNYKYESIIKNKFSN